MGIVKNGLKLQASYVRINLLLYSGPLPGFFGEAVTSVDPLFSRRVPHFLKALPISLGRAFLISTPSVIYHYQNSNTLSTIFNIYWFHFLH